MTVSGEVATGLPDFYDILSKSCTLIGVLIHHRSGKRNDDFFKHRNRLFRGSVVERDENIRSSRSTGEQAGYQCL